MNETSKTVLDAASLAVVGSTLAAWLPPIAALLSIIWTSFRLFEIVARWWEKKKKDG
jgi:hypothetical protein|tara:strand:+ start:332 stop:502 length:171 start_codon:yes stop_codon:yes gene_type:complete